MNLYQRLIILEKRKKENKYYTTSAYYDSLPTYDFLSSIDSANVVFLFGTPTSIQITTDNTILIYDVLIKSKKQDHRQLVFTIRRKINKLYVLIMIIPHNSKTATLLKGFL
jgi:hypothetical protein